MKIYGYPKSLFYIKILYLFLKYHINKHSFITQNVKQDQILPMLNLITFLFIVFMYQYNPICDNILNIMTFSRINVITSIQL